jgi:hypothetical protein
MSDQLHDRAENLYEEIGGNLCICQGAYIPRWCEKCQQRIGFIRSVFIRLQNETYHDLCNSLGIPRERDKDGAYVVLPPVQSEHWAGRPDYGPESDTHEDRGYQPPRCEHKWGINGCEKCGQPSMPRC